MEPPGKVIGFSFYPQDEFLKLRSFSDLIGSLQDDIKLFPFK